MHFVMQTYSNLGDSGGEVNFFGRNSQKGTSLADFTCLSHWLCKSVYEFLPRCMECRRCLAMRILSVRPSVWLSVSPSLCQTRDLKDHLP